MPIEKWSHITTALREELLQAIAVREADFTQTIPEYLCLNNLKSKLERLHVIERNLGIDKYMLVFIGTIGEGKTTAICHLFNLVGEFNATRTIAGRQRTLREVQELLATGSGRVTICEVLIKASDTTYIEIDPYSREEMENMILDFCDSLSDSANLHGEQGGMLSKEIETAIRNVTQLPKETVTEGYKRIRIDRAKEELERSGIDGLKSLAIRNAGLTDRAETRLSFRVGQEERLWIKNTFARVNNGEEPNVAIPRKIHIGVSRKMLADSPLSSFEQVVDTKGLDENPIRKDLADYINREDAICLFVTNFKDAPEANIRELMKFHLASKSKDLHHRFVTFVLPHKGDPEKISGGDGTWEVGTEIRREDIQSAFKNLNLEFFQENILFFDALRYYKSDVNAINGDLYTAEDLGQDRQDCVAKLLRVIDRRRAILRDEVEGISLGFQKIKQGEMLSATEVQALESAVQKIRELCDLKKRVPSFVYDEFIDEYVHYYRNKYHAWNTKHAINRRFGVYDLRQVNIYYDAGVVAQGKSNEEMLRKFTSAPKSEIEGILDELKQTNDALEPFISEILTQFNAHYDQFVEQVGSDVVGYVREKLSPQAPESEFWQALIAEKGKQRAKGETYTDNVCQTYRRELESETGLNRHLEARANARWRALVLSVLRYFGEEVQ